MRRGFLNAARPAKSGVGVRDAAPASSRRKSSPPPLEDPDECAGQDGLASGDTCAAAVHMDVITDIDGINGDQQRMEVDLTSSVRGCCSSASSAPGLSNAPSPGAAVVMPQMEESGGASTSASLPNRIEESMMHAETAEDNLRKPAGSLHECLALLRGSSDEQRLVGLLLATKFVSGPDESAIRAIFDAVGFEFINRLCKSGTGRRMEGRVGAEKKQDEEESLKQQEAFRHLALTLISAFCRLPDVASSVHIIRKVPMFLDIIRSREGEGPVGDSYECLVAVAGASEDGLRAVQQSDALGLIATDLSAFGFEFGWTPLSIKLMAMLVSAAGEDMFHTHSAALAAAIPSFARSFFRRQDELKFEILQILGVLLASYASRAVRQRIAINDCSRPTSSMEPEWAKNVRSGLAEILNSRVAISHRRLAIQVVRGMVELMGEEWMLGLVESMNSDDRSPPGERFFLLVVATISVEISMLLDEVAKEMSDPSASIEEQQAFMHKCFILADCYVLLERVIEVMSRTSAERDNVEDEDDMVADEQGVKTSLSLSHKVLTDDILLKVIKIVDEVVAAILNFFTDAEKKERTQSDIMLASVRAVGRYLAEAVGAHKEQVLRLLRFMLSITAKDEERPVHAVRFLLPALISISRETKGCKALVACNGHKKIVACLQGLAPSAGPQSREGAAKPDSEDGEAAFNVAMVEACDVLLNVMNLSDDFHDLLEGKDILAVLPVLVQWCMTIDTSSAVGGQMFAMGACTIAMAMRLSDEETLIPFLQGMGRAETFGCMLSILLRFLQHGEGVSPRLAGGSMEDKDVWEVAVAACTSILCTYPSLKREIVSPGGYLESLCGSRDVTAASLSECVAHPGLRLLLATAAGIMEGAEDGRR